MNKKVFIWLKNERMRETENVYMQIRAKRRSEIARSSKRGREKWVFGEKDVLVAASLKIASAIYAIQWIPTQNYLSVIVFYVYLLMYRLYLYIWFYFHCILVCCSWNKFSINASERAMYIKSWTTQMW